MAQRLLKLFYWIDCYVYTLIKNHIAISYNYAMASKQIKLLNSQNKLASRIIKFCHDYDNIKKNLTTESKILK